MSAAPIKEARPRQHASDTVVGGQGWAGVRGTYRPPPPPRVPAVCTALMMAVGVPAMLAASAGGAGAGDDSVVRHPTKSPSEASTSRPAEVCDNCEGLSPMSTRTTAVFDCNHPKKRGAQGRALCSLVRHLVQPVAIHGHAPRHPQVPANPARARSTVPDSVKAELLSRIQHFVTSK